MDVKTLQDANALYTRMLSVQRLRKQSQKLPITIQSGMGQTLEFSVLADEATTDAIKQLDDEVHSKINSLLDSYFDELQKAFDRLGEN